jgi:O-acetylhomoserine (thiol)-lyase
MSGFGVVVSFDLKAGADAGRRFTDALQLFSMAASIGATDSLVMPPQLLGSRDLTPEQQRISSQGPGTVRLSIGLEDCEDLLADLEQALAASQVG